MSFVADINEHGGHVVMYLYRQTPLTNSPDLKLASKYKHRKVQLELPEDGDDNVVNVSSGNLEASADGDELDLEEKTYTFQGLN